MFLNPLRKCFQKALLLQLIVVFALCKTSAESPRLGRCETSLMADEHIKTNHALFGHSFTNLSVTSSKECHYYCLHECRCLSFQIKGQTCELLDEDWFTAPNDLRPTAGYTQYYMSREYVEQVSNVCSPSCKNECCKSQPCFNNGVCRELCEDPRKRFSCTCTDGYTGKLSQTRITGPTSPVHQSETHAIHTTSAVISSPSISVNRLSKISCISPSTDVVLSTSVTSSRYCANGYCASQPCLNGATCIETCTGLDRRFKCTCAEGFTGELCETKAMFCVDYINNKSGIYTLFDKKGSTFQVYCDFDSEEDFVWTLMESFSLSLRNMTNRKGFANNWPVNQGRLHWREFRLSHFHMEQIQNKNATHIRATCNFNVNGLNFTDYARAKLSNFRILKTKIQACVMFEFVSVRSKHCTNCWVRFFRK